MHTVVPEVYEDPSSDLNLASSAITHLWVVWAVVVFVWASALYYAYVCRRQGGYPVISATWRGFRVACNR